MVNTSTKNAISHIFPSHNKSGFKSLTEMRFLSRFVVNDPLKLMYNKRNTYMTPIKKLLLFSKGQYEIDVFFV
ncbi:hypothetical protein VCRA2116O30_160045 [Vibrio crassostreae]|nr:hypothetical protein VCRA2117O39_150045 [Vibrio crassostreae]CAK1778970.1 hypothetical protein VCRA2113O20_150045 [Vibrio crassostreae]CAK1802362.1 hypothetical protein VCRA2116O30_160045 [Vibrio crassostreae]CAK1806257.1 hypothetical protein VCRA2119O45_160079 [Vibrio crassostreae]CAK2005974.1 hypothetical protein VCRA2116O31_20301 [Vibrio crassostreae]